MIEVIKGWENCRAVPKPEKKNGELTVLPEACISVALQKTAMIWRDLHELFFKYCEIR